MDIERKIHQEFVECGKNAREWMQKCKFLLPEIEKRQIWRKRNFNSIFEYAAKLAGMSKSSVEDSLRILKKIEDKPELKKIAAEKGLNRIRPIATIATKETEQFWAEKANCMSRHTLETYVQNYRLESRTGPATQPVRTSNTTNATNTDNAILTADNAKDAAEEMADEMVEVTMKLDKDLFDQLQKLKGDGDWNEAIKQLLKARNAELELNKPEAVRIKSRHIPTKIREYVLNKTNKKCAYPGCNKTYKILHHTQRFALEKIHDPDRIVPLCEAHERLAHLGLIANEDQSPKHWKLNLKADQADHKQFVDRQVWLHR